MRASILQGICRYFAGKNQATYARYPYAYDRVWRGEHSVTLIARPMAQGRGEHYATPPSPRSIRKSNPGHTSTGSRFTTSACGSCAPCLVVHSPTLAARAPPPTPGDARHGPSRQGLSQDFRLTGWHVLKAGDWAEAGERWALPLPAPLHATHGSDSASAVPYFSAGYVGGAKTRRDLGLTGGNVR